MLSNKTVKCYRLVTGFLPFWLSRQWMRIILSLLRDFWEFWVTCSQERVLICYWLLPQRLENSSLLLANSSSKTIWIRLDTWHQDQLIYLTQINTWTECLGDIYIYICCSLPGWTSFQNTSVEKDVSHVLYFAMITCSLFINNFLDVC